MFPLLVLAANCSYVRLPAGRVLTGACWRQRLSRLVIAETDCSEQPVWVGPAHP
ncbi:hypothetical protein Ae717Ps2_6628 [Pseudonocardia sp. Ae717_Ps2]|nr:hypothetical protein Ae717Ps2_6628 [Pseudonocardia sp. Ae717_Ps2]